MPDHDDDRRAGSLASPPTLLIHYERDGIRVASFSNVALVYWGSRATREPVRALGTTSAELIKKYGHISVVQVIPDNVGLPDEEVRGRLLKLVELGAPSLACLVYVLGGDGFWGSAVRALITNTAWVGQRPFVARTCATLEEAAAWLPAPHAERTRVALEPSRLLDALRRASNGTRPERPEGAASIPRRQSET